MQNLMILALVFSPIYLWSSGLPQVSHMLVASVIGLRIVTKPHFSWDRLWIAGAAFVLYAFIVAFIVYANYGDLHTLMAPVYYAFGFMVFLLIVTISREEGEPFLKKVFYLHFVALGILIALTVLDFGRVYGGFREMGTFNDPNQMANWILWATIIICVAGRTVYGSWLPGLFALGLASIGVISTASRSGGLGLIALATVYGLMGFTSLLRFFVHRVHMRALSWVALSFFLITLLFGIIAISVEGEHIQSISCQTELWLTRYQQIELDNSLEVRGYDRLWKFPEYLILGAGEGAHERYTGQCHFLGEIHSSWAGLLFNYGCVGAVLFFGFIYAILRRTKNAWFKLMLLAPFLYGFSTYNIRNWYFWVGLAVLYISWELLREQQTQDNEATLYRGVT